MEENKQEQPENTDKKEISEEEKKWIQYLADETGYPYQWLLDLYNGGELQEIHF